jgi:hypothetical protein
MNLSFEIIESFGLKKKFVTPDWDDAGYEFTLPSGIVLTGFHMLNTSPYPMDTLEGLSGFIYIKTKEELEKLISLTYEQTLQYVKEKNPEFNIEEWI